MILQFASITVAFLLFALFHSLFAAPSIKKRLQSALGKYGRFYRLSYNILSFIALLLIYIFLPPAGPIIYEIQPPWSWLMRALQAAALVTFALALRDFEVRQFLGLTAFRQADPDMDERLSIKGMFRYCRHPLYTSSSLFLLAEPHMTSGLLAYTCNIMLYFIIGSVFEERNLEKKFGRAYTNYAANVPKFITSSSSLSPR